LLLLLITIFILLYLLPLQTERHSCATGEQKEGRTSHGDAVRRVGAVQGSDAWVLECDEK
jgi:hypothetical protein